MFHDVFDQCLWSVAVLKDKKRSRVCHKIEGDWRLFGDYQKSKLDPETEKKCAGRGNLVKVDRVFDFMGSSRASVKPLSSMFAEWFNKWWLFAEIGTVVHQPCTFNFSMSWKSFGTSEIWWETTKRKMNNKKSIKLCLYFLKIVNLVSMLLVK